MAYNSRSALNSVFRLRNLLFTTKSEWERITPENTPTKELFLNFAFPIVVLCSIIAGFGTWIHEESIALAIARVLVDFLAMNIGFFCAAKIIILLLPNFQLAIDDDIIFKLVIYSASVFCLFHGIAHLFSPDSFLNQMSLLMELYFIRILWLGTSPLLPIAENKRPGFTVMASLLILVIPLIFERMFSILFRLPLSI